MKFFLSILLFLGSCPVQAISRRQAIGTFLSAACYIATDQYKKKCNLQTLNSSDSLLPGFANDALVEIHTSIGPLKGRKICDGQLVGNRRTIVTAAHCSNLVNQSNVKVFAKRWSSEGKNWAINPSLQRSLELVDCALDQDLTEKLTASLKNLRNTVGFMSHQDLAILQLDIAAPEWVTPIPLAEKPANRTQPTSLHYTRYLKDEKGFWSTTFLDNKEVLLQMDAWPVLALHSQSPMCTSMSGGGLFKTVDSQTELIGIASALIGPHMLRHNAKNQKLSCTIPANAKSKNYFFLIGKHYNWLKKAVLMAGKSKLGRASLLNQEAPKKSWLRITPDKKVKPRIFCSDEKLKISFSPNSQDSMGEISDSIGHDFWIKRGEESTYLVGIRNQLDKNWQDAGIYFPEQSYDSFLYDPEDQKAVFLDLTNQHKKIHLLTCTSTALKQIK